VILKALIVEQLECDGHLKTFEMYAEPSRHLRVAFADESENPRSGPFHFLDRRDERRFEAGFAHCTLWKLSKSKFITKSGEFVFKHSWRGIPTGQGFLSCYTLSLPEFAVPTCVEFKDRRADRLDADKIIRDDQRNRIVLYFECRAATGYDSSFSLHVAFRIDQDDFRNFESREHNNQLPYEYSLNREEKLAIVQFLSQEVAAPVPREPLEPSVAGTPSQLELIPPVTPMSPNRVEVFGANACQNSTRSGQKQPKKLPPKKHDYSEMFDAARLTEKQREVISLRLEHGLGVSEIADRLGRSRKTVYGHFEAAKRKLNYARSGQRSSQKKAERPD
jgi:DNA-binding CsgD family transcriptional regulator